MTCYRDLDPINYFPIGDNVPLQAVGWLGKEFEFQTGRVSQQFFEKLSELAENPWQPFIAAGFHTCELCQFSFFEHTSRGTSNLFIPLNGVIYVMPSLILHYINAHYYLPPEKFIEAVIQCPAMKSMEYKKLLLKFLKA